MSENPAGPVNETEPCRLFGDDVYVSMLMMSTIILSLGEKISGGQFVAGLDTTLSLFIELAPLQIDRSLPIVCKWGLGVDL